MTDASGSLSKHDFMQAAEEFGYQYTHLSPGPAPRANGQPLFQGRVGLRSLPCGISLCSSDLKSLQESRHEGVVSRSLNIAVALDGAAADCTLGTRNRFHLGPGSAVVVSVADGMRLAGRVEAGQQTRNLLVRARSEDLADDDVAERVDTLLRTTSVVPLALNVRTDHLVNELFLPSAVGGIGRLLAESCALELLARALSHGESETAGREPVSPRDHAKIMLVRDKLLAEPGHEHTLDELAREAGLSVSALKAKFRQVIGQPVFAFLRDTRLQRARGGIEQEGWTIAQAAYFVGYRHQSNFSTAFRRRFGFSPGVIRRR